MKNRDKILSIVIILIIIYLVANMGAINNFLMSATDKTIQLDHTNVAVPEAWNTTVELGMTEDSKCKNAITNGYVIWDIFEDWPESTITDLSREKLANFESGNYEPLKSSVVELGGAKVSKEYFYNPSRDSDTQWDCIGVTYVFVKEDCNYAVQIHYFTKNDYKNQSYTNELDDRVEDLMANMHNQHYDAFFSRIGHVINAIIPSK